MLNKLAAVEVDLLDEAIAWVKNEAVPETLIGKLAEEMLETLVDTVVDTLVEAEVDLLAVTLARVEMKTPVAT